MKYLSLCFLLLLPGCPQLQELLRKVQPQPKQMDFDPQAGFMIPVPGVGPIPARASVGTGGSGGGSLFAPAAAGAAAAGNGTGRRSFIPRRLPLDDDGLVTPQVASPFIPGQ